MLTAKAARPENDDAVLSVDRWRERNVSTGMLKQLALASLLASACSAAYADHTTAPTPPPGPQIRMPTDACTLQGDVLFEQAVLPEEGAYQPTHTTTVYSTGGWKRLDVDADGKVVSTASGCLSAIQMKTIRDNLSAAKWTVKLADVVCGAVSTIYTAYSSHGKHLFDQHMCGREYLDDASQNALTAITLLLADATKVVTPPCCKK